MPQEPKTIKVKIAVAFTADGKWNASGWKGVADIYELRGCAIDGLDPEGTDDVYFATITAEIPLPESVKVKGKVEDAAR